MSAVNFSWDGLAELKEALRNLPVELTTQGQRVIQGEGNYAALQIRSAYPDGGTGTLRDRVVVEPLTSGPYFAGVRVASRAPHAHLYEWGTAIRHTAKGANRGAMFGTPEQGRPTVVPALEQARAAMYDALADLLEQNGLAVTR